jgi:4-amino-4-deoxy-L-arabinose transferase-like glycosyltransferase
MASTGEDSVRSAPYVPLPPFAIRPVLGIAGAVVALLVTVAGRYGYHRDELYFIAAGRHLSWGYPDQPPLVPVLARVLSDVAPGSLVTLRIPSALAAGVIVVLTALLAREFGGRREAQMLAAGSMAVASLLLGAGHLLSTTTFDLLTWALLLWLFTRVLRTGDERLWLVVGVVAGVGLLNSDLTGFLVGAVMVGIAASGPRRKFASRWLWVGGIVAAVMWAPYLVWQAKHDWPQLAVSRAIAAGRSGSSEPRSLFVPFQLGLVSPFLAPVWIVGLIRLLRDSAIRWCRAIGIAYVLLAVVFLAAGGKPYYLGGMFPILLAVGAQPSVDWLRRGRRRLRHAALAAAFALSAGSMLVTLPVVPVASLHKTPIVDVNYDLGETIGWPTYVHEIAAVYERLPAVDRPNVAILAGNYGEAGAIDRYGPAAGLPRAYSGQTGYWYWGPPPDRATTLLVVGLERTVLQRSFRDIRIATHLDNKLQINNDEQHAPVWICNDPREDWSTLWPRFRDL